MIGVTPHSTKSVSDSYLYVELKKGSNCFTGLPLLLQTVLPVPTQRSSTWPMTSVPLLL